MNPIIISGTGLYHPPYVVTNEELVQSFNEYVRLFNQKNAEKIAENKLEPLKESSSAFILKASGIQQRYVLEKTGILNPEIMKPIVLERANSECSHQAEMAVNAAREALLKANKKPEEIDVVIVAGSNFQRPYPAIAIEVQQFLEIKGFAFDMNVACSSATFALQVAADLIQAGHARAALVINSEICSAGLNFCDRDSHFIFGDAATAVVLEPKENANVPFAFEIVSSRLCTQFSNNIRSNFGYLNDLDPKPPLRNDTLFVQSGKQVFKEIVPKVIDWIAKHLQSVDLTAQHIKRFWLHQANLNMNNLIMEKLLGRLATTEEAPIILNEYANTASAGSVISFHLHQHDFNEGELGLLSSFGAGYSIGSLVLRYVNLSR